MIDHASRPKTRPTRREPALGGQQPAHILSGLEPLLGGARRVGVEDDILLAILTANTRSERDDQLQKLATSGQGSLYAKEISQFVAERARLKMGTWRGVVPLNLRLAAIHALEQIGGAESVSPLLVALTDSTYQAREAAESALIAVCERVSQSEDSRLRGETADSVLLLVNALRTLPLNARKVVARILTNLSTDLVLGPLLMDGLTAPEWHARCETAWVLGTLGDRRATRRLITALDDQSPQVRASAAWALGHLDAPIALGPLATAIQDSDEVVRAAAVEALGDFAIGPSIDEEAYASALMTIAKALEDAEMSVRYAATSALIGLDSPEARGILRNLPTRR